MKRTKHTQQILSPLTQRCARIGARIKEIVIMQWTDLSESEGNKVAREVGLLAHRILHADLTDTEKSLH